LTVTTTLSGVLLDIEGTTTPISFVYDVLFPFAESRLGEACRGAAAGTDFREAVNQLRREYESEPDRGNLPGFDDGASYARWLMNQDRKSTGLKTLQGLIWEDGYRTGLLKSQIFEDVFPALEEWKKRGIQVRIFSSGSVLAQRLLFGHTQWGDITSFFAGFHDTRTGPKRGPGSYQVIAGEFCLPAEEILFLSDVLEELQAARQAGIRTGLVIRPGNKPVADSEPHPVYYSFSEIIV
jgi:enolase-phosphatase E1